MTDKSIIIKNINKQILNLIYKRNTFFKKKELLEEFNETYY